MSDTELYPHPNSIQYSRLYPIFPRTHFNITLLSTP
jgi:hypothetical protein